MSKGQNRLLYPIQPSGTQSKVCKFSCIEMTIPTDRTQPLLIVLSGPSGVGKDAILTELKKLPGNYLFTVTATTRKIRPGENNGIDYIFLSAKKFKEAINAKEFIEWSEVYGNFYGVPRDQIDEALADGKNAIVKIDVQGAKTIKQLKLPAIFIFISPPSQSELRDRLIRRMTETPEALELRLDTAISEMAESIWCDYEVINHTGQLRHTAEQISNIIKKDPETN